MSISPNDDGVGEGPSVPHPSNHATFDEYQTSLQGTALRATKQAFVLPVDMDYQRTINKRFALDMDTLSTRILSLTDKLLKFSAGNGKGKSRIKEDEDLTERYNSSVLDVVDHLFEIADKNIDEFTGKNKPASIPINAPVRRKADKSSKSKSYPSLSQEPLHPSLIHAVNIPKPQLQFRTPVNNANDYGTWRPKIRSKYHASVPLDYVPEVNPNDMDAEDQQIAILHPYYHEINHLQYPDRIYNPPTSSVLPSPPPFQNTPFKYISVPAELDDLLATLKTAQEIAIDLEHNDRRSYYGLVCLMQISTREQDWVVDTLALRDELSVLGEVFADPNIVKVFHGASSDIIWLQRDFGLYIVNMFDTYHASLKLGGFPRHNLASLLQHFCNFEADKRYQIADWRIRPLPEEMLFYARSDTHFLLYVYDSLRSLLLQHSQQQSSNPHDALDKVLQNSSLTSLQVYIRESYDLETGRGEYGWANLLKKYSTRLGPVERSVFIALHAWRDKIARELDEGLSFVAKNHQLLAVAELCGAQPSQIPNDQASLFRAFAPTPFAVRDRVPEVLEVIQNAAARGWEERNAIPPAVAPAQHDSAVAATSESNLPLSPSLAPTEFTLTLPDVWSAINSIAEVNKDDFPIAQSSSMFRSATPLDCPPPNSVEASIVTSNSSLFGPLPAYNPPDTNPVNASFSSIQQKIHSSLVVIPTANRITTLAPAAAPHSSEESDVEDPDDLIMPAELPFVPAAQRTTLVEEARNTVATTRDPNTGDEIVVVGRVKQKKAKSKIKRKLIDAELDGGGQSGASTLAPDVNAEGDRKTADDVERASNTTAIKRRGARGGTEVAPFDYASAPNLLDAHDGDDGADGSGVGRAKRKKIWKEKVPVIQYGNFPAPPRSKSGFRGGNVSASFT